jgi:dipeptidyl aminopeptidase/acylaminoacyl peptidase
VLAHGTNADRSSLLPEAKLLAEAGFGVLALDFPGQGASPGKTLWGAHERQSISAAIDWLSMRPEVDSERIGGFGLSLGAYVLTQAAVLDSRLRAIALAACPSDIVEQTRLASNRWGLLSELPAVWALRASGMPFTDMLPKDVIGRIAPRAVLLLGGDSDPIVPESMIQSLYRSAQEPKELWIVHGAGHGGYANLAPREYTRRLVGFFRRTLVA